MSCLVRHVAVQSGVRTALLADGIGLIAVIDDTQAFGPSGHNYTTLCVFWVPLKLLAVCAKSDELYVL